MINKPINSIESSDLDALVANAVPEGKLLDYKRDLPGPADADKKELLADASSFANTAGGFLIFGVEETSGVPSAIVGIRFLTSMPNFAGWTVSWQRALRRECATRCAA